MKLSLLLGLLAMFSLSVSAKEAKQPLVCSNAQGDTGYILTLKPGGKKGVLQENNIAGAFVVANLTCKKVKGTGPHGADTMDLIETCEGKNSKGEEVEVSISAGGFWFHIDADLKIGKRLVAENILCNSLR